MNLKIEIKNREAQVNYLSIFIIGLLQCLEEDVILVEDAEQIFFKPYYMDLFGENLPMIVQLIHQGTELSDIKTIISQTAYNHEIKKMKLEAYRNIELEDRSVLEGKFFEYVP